MPTTPYTYLDLQIMFQDRYEASVKPLEVDYVLSTDTILEYLYNTELEILHELAVSKQYNLLRGHTIVEDVTAGLVATTVAPNVLETANVDFDYFLKAHSTITATYIGVTTYTGTIENELILQEDAGIYYQNEFNIPYFKSPKIYIEAVNDYVPSVATEKKFIVIVDGYTTLTTLTVTYIKLPSVPTPTTPCYSDYTLYGRIVDTAVTRAISDLAKLSSSKRGNAE